MFTLGAITILIFVARFFLFNFQESPKFLLYRGKDEEAVKVLNYIAKYNKVDCKVSLESFRQLREDKPKNSSSDPDGHGRIVLGSGDKMQNLSLMQKAKLELLRLKVLFGTPSMAWLCICIWIVYAFDYWGFTISGAYLPTILQKKNASIGVGIKSTYRSYIYIYLFGIPGVLLGTTIYKWRQPSMILSSLLFALMLFTFSAVNGQASYIGLSGKLMHSQDNNFRT